MCGALIKDLGKKCFGINKIEDENIVRDMSNKIAQIHTEKSSV